MNAKVQEKQKALELRRRGYSYQDILAEVAVAKSSLSLWLNDLPLTAEEKHVLKRRKDANVSRGKIRAAATNRMRRVVRDGFLLRDAKDAFKHYSVEPFFHIGISLYWAEGSKRGSSFMFTNSDPSMMELMVKWIERYLGIQRERIRARLYTHKPFAHDNAEKFWSETTGIPIENFGKTIYKPTGLLVKKRPNYKGCLRMELGVVSFRKMQFWQKMLVELYRK